MGARCRGWARFHGCDPVNYLSVNADQSKNINHSISVKAVSFYNASTYLRCSLLFQIKSHGCGVSTVELTMGSWRGEKFMGNDMFR